MAKTGGYEKKGKNYSYLWVFLILGLGEGIMGWANTFVPLLPQKNSDSSL